MISNPPRDQHAPRDQHLHGCDLCHSHMQAYGPIGSDEGLARCKHCYYKQPCDELACPCAGRHSLPQMPRNPLMVRLQEMVGKTVIIEGTFPIPLPNGQVAYAPAKGKLVAVYVSPDGYGFDVLEEGDTEPVLYMSANLRSVQVYVEKLIARVNNKLDI